MNRDTLKQIMVDQKDIYLNNPLIARHYPLEENINYCFVGIRRCGKSYMMYQQIQTLLEKKVPLSQIVYVNFEDERLLEMTADDLNTILEIGLELSGAGNKPYLFLDEIQNIDGWEKFVRRIADMKYKISITGSNSKMLSSEIASTLGGRFVIMNIYPYSFAEYLIANGKEKNYLDTISTSDKAELLAQYNEYVTYGAYYTFLHLPCNEQISFRFSFAPLSSPLSDIKYVAYYLPMTAANSFRLSSADK